MPLVVHGGEVQPNQDATTHVVAQHGHDDHQDGLPGIDLPEDPESEEEGGIRDRVLEAAEGEHEDGHNHDGALGEVVGKLAVVDHEHGDVDAEVA